MWCHLSFNTQTHTNKKVSKWSIHLFKIHYNQATETKVLIQNPQLLFFSGSDFDLKPIDTKIDTIFTFAPSDLAHKFNPNLAKVTEDITKTPLNLDTPAEGQRYRDNYKLLKCFHGVQKLNNIERKIKWDNFLSIIFILIYITN